MNGPVPASRLRRPLRRRDAARDAAPGTEADAAAPRRAGPAPRAGTAALYGSTGDDALMSTLPPFLAVDAPAVDSLSTGSLLGDPAAGAVAPGRGPLLYTPAGGAGDLALMSTMADPLSSSLAPPDASAAPPGRLRPPGGPAPPADPRATTPASLAAAERARSARRRTATARPAPSAATLARAREGWPVSGEPGLGPTLAPLDEMPRFSAPTAPRSEAVARRDLDAVARAEAALGMSLGPEAREAVLREAALADRSAGDSPAVRTVLGSGEVPRSAGDIAAAHSSAAVGDARLASGATEPATSSRDDAAAAARSEAPAAGGAAPGAATAAAGGPGGTAAGRSAAARGAGGAAGAAARRGGGGGGDPAEELEDAESLMSDNAAALQLLEEWNREPYPAVEVPVLSLPFNAPGSIDLRVPPPPPRPPDQPIEGSVTPEAAAQQARDAYASTAGLARRWQDEVVSEAHRAMRMLAERSDAMAVRIEDVFTPAVESVTRTLGGARTELARAAEASAREIEVEERRARRAVGGATASGRTAISAAAAGAVAQLPGIRTELRQRFDTLYETSGGEIENSGQWAEREIKSTAKKNAVRALYRDEGTAPARAQKEAQRNAVDEQMDRLGETLRHRADGEAQTMRNRITAPGPGGDPSTAAKIEGFILGVRQHITGRTPPPPPPPNMSVAEDTSGTALEQRGIAAVNRSQGQALQSLHRQGKGARRTLRMAERSGRQQLATQRRAALTQLAQLRRARRDMLQQAVLAALRAVSNGIQAGAAAYGDSTRRLAEGLEKSAAQGPAALVDSARRSSTQVTQSLGDARRTQLDKLGTVRGGAVNTVERQPQEVAVQATQSGLVFEDTMRGVQRSVVDSMNEQVRAQTRGFIDSANTVRQTTASYTAPMRTQYRQAITDQVKALDPVFAAEQTAVSTTVGRITGQHLAKVNNPNAELTTGMAEVARATINRIDERAREAGSAFGIVNLDENALIASVRGVTAIQGEAVCVRFGEMGNGNLRNKIESEHDALVTGLNDDEYNAITNYLAGRTAEGALAELETTVSIWGNDGRRAEDIMRGLSDEQLRQMTTGPNAETWRSVSGRVSRGLYGTDRNVFEALSQDYPGRRARADAYRLRDRIDTARRNNDSEAVYRALQDVARADPTDPRHPGGDERFQAVQREFAHITGAIDLNMVGPPDQNAAAEALARYVTEDKTETVYTEGGGSYEVTHRITGLDADLARAMARHGPNSVEARATRMLRESERTGAAPNVEALDDAVLDPRLNPSLHPDATPEERREMEAAARGEQERLFQRYAELARAHGVAGVPETTADVRAFLADRTASRFGDSAEDRASADYTRSLLTSDRLDARGAAAAMHSAIVMTGTNEDRIHRILSRMSRAEIEAMRQEYQAQYGRDLYAELGVYPGSGALADWLGGGEVSGDERLRVERELMGVPQNDRERAEVALYANQQQQENRGVLSSALDLGGDQYAAMERAHERLSETVGGSVGRDEYGRPRVIGGNFDTRGRFTGDQLAFMQDVSMSSATAENYSARIDAIASAVTTTIMIVGAVVATIATAGGAGPLVLAAVAAGTGLASIAANRLISGGRYGWEQAAVDLGMTAVQAATAGIGASLGAGVKATSQAAQAAARAGNMSLARTLAQRAFVMNVRNGMITGAMGSAAGTALDERTWARGIGAGFEDMFFAGFKGAASGGITAAVSNSIDLIGRPGASLGDRVGALGTGRNLAGDAVGRLRTGGEVVLRGVTRGSLGFAGSFLGHGAEIAIDAGRGRFQGSGADAFDAMVRTGAQSGLQDLLGGLGEGRAARWHGDREEARSRRAGRADDGEARPGAPRPDEHEEGPRAPRPHEEGEDGARAAARPHDDAEGPRAAPRITADAEAAAARPAPAEEAAAGPRRAAEADDAADAEAPALRPADTEAPPEAAARPRTAAGDEPDAAAATAARAARPFAEGTAASVPESSFHGRAARRGTREAASTRVLKGAVRRLLALAAELHGAHLPNPADPTRLVLPTANGEEVNVRLRVGRGLPSDEVARFHVDPSTGDYVIVVSPGARADHVERAIAHELAEIRSGHGRAAGEDVLTPARRRPAGPNDPPPRLSPHDEGRLAELRVIARQLETARGAEARNRLQGELDALVQHLGLANSVEGSSLRRSLVAQALGDLGDARFHVLGAVERNMPAAFAAGEIAAMRRAAGEGGGLVEAEMQRLPAGPAEGARVARAWQAGGETPGEARANRIRVEASNRAQAREEFGRMLQAALLDPSQHNPATLRTLEYLTPRQVERVIRTGELPESFPFHHLMTVAEFPELAHRGDSGLGLPERVHIGEGHGDDTRVAPQAGTMVRGESEANLPFQHDARAAGTGGRATPRDIADGRRSTGDIDRDILVDQRRRLERMRADAATLETRATAAAERLARARTDGTGEGRLGRLQRVADSRRAEADAAAARVVRQLQALEKLEQRIAAPAIDGTASRIVGSTEMQPGTRRLAPDEFEPTLRRAAEAAVGEGGLIEGARAGPLRHGADERGPFVEVPLVRHDGTLLRVVVRVGAVEGTEAANFRQADADGREFHVTLSDRVDPRAAGRAVSHELEEIRYHVPRTAEDGETAPPTRPRMVEGEAALYGRRPSADSLRPGVEVRAETVLSAHDRGRLVEARDLTRRLAAARAAGQAGEVTRLTHELEVLAAELGLVRGRHAPGRLRLAESGLGSDAATIAALRGAAESAKANPLLQPRRHTMADLQLLGRQIEHARAIGSPEVASELMAVARQRVREAGALDRLPSVRERARAEIDAAELEAPGSRAIANEAIAREEALDSARSLQAQAAEARNSAEQSRAMALRATIRAIPEGGSPEAQERAARQAAIARRCTADAEAALARAARFDAEAAAMQRVADRPIGASIDDARAGRVMPLGPSGRWYHMDHPGRPEHQELLRQYYGDSPEFRNWQDFFNDYLRLNPSLYERGLHMREIERIFGYWLSGQTIDADSGRARALEDRRRLPRGRGTDVDFTGSADLTQPVTMRNSATDKTRPAEDAALAQGRLALNDAADAAEAAGDTARAARLRTAAARVAALEAGRPLTTSAQTALDDYNALRLARSVLEARMAGASDAERAVLQSQCERLGSMINVRSEVLGTVAGLAYGASVAGAVRLPVDAVGADAPDLMYQVGGRLLIVECKGGDAQLGTRTARVGGEEVTAPQNTPEALRSLALDMINGRNRTENDRIRGQQILDALNATPPAIDYVVVRQPVNPDGTAGPIEVVTYPITRSGAG
jgi:hypothetical protein